MPIRILPPEVASQIAAGEVVERPASVIKELVENALDAGAASIEIRTEAGGSRLIEVSDNGCGIPANELQLAVERHATSKLRNPQDLFKISSLGFRGEALASIGSISKMKITSRIEASNIGALIELHAGSEPKVKPAGSPVGTSVRVVDLFYNVPARLKFLKHERTEKRYITRLVTRYALAFPSVRFHLIQDNRVALKTSGNGDRREVLAALYGTETAKTLLEVTSVYDSVHIHGFTSPPSVTRSNRSDIYFYVNNRPVQDTALAGALLKAYHTLLMVKRYPISVLFLDLPHEQVDVNVHPTKAEVRFRDTGKVFTSVQNAVRKALLAYSQVPGMNLQPRWTDQSIWKPSNSHIDPAWHWSSELSGDRSEISAGDNQISWQEELSTPRIPLLRPVGQVASAYLVAEAPDGLYLIDQHAAHERILFERFMDMAEKSAPSQLLLQPASVDFPADQAQIIEEQLDLITKLGFQVEQFGKDSFLIRAIPSILENFDPVQALRIIVEDFEEDETPLKSENEARIVARICKRAAVKAGQSLSPDEQRALISDLEACQSPRTCPHGRPTMIHLSVNLLERQFGRKGAR